jgi:para-aminobenzoate synthetase component 1
LQSLASPLGHSTKAGIKTAREIIGADDGVRTRDLNLGKVPRYQLRYVRKETKSSVRGQASAKEPGSDKFTYMESAVFWMGGYKATDLIQITNNPGDIDDGFWAISTTFDGEFIGVKFGKVERSDWQGSYQPLKSRNWISSHDQAQYCQLVENFRNEIANGNVYQVNACRVLTNETREGIAGLLSGILQQNPAQYAGYLKIPGLEITSASPETFLQRRGKFLKSSPIKGTRKSGLSGRFPEKDESENIMIVDLMRNDLGKVCIEDTVQVENLLKITELPGLAHLISDVVGELRPDTTWAQIFEATLPPGSVSGAPKSSAIKLISKYEGVDRGPYCGAFGWVHGDQADLAVAIRTFWSDGERVKFGTGAGITWASDSLAEWEETELKAARLIAIANGEI